MPINESQKPFSKKITQAHWDAIFGKKPPRKPKRAKKPIKSQSELVDDMYDCHCGCEGCGFDCGCLCS